MEVSTTTPAAPTGLTPTEVPLGITATTTLTGGPVNIPRLSSKSLTLENSIYINKFEINTVQTPGTLVYQMNTQFPLGDFENRYNDVSQNNNSIQFFVPWNLISSFYSKFCKIDWILEIVPVKVADCRVIIDVVFGYDDSPFTSDDPLIYLANDTVSFKLDSQNAPIQIVIPHFWATEMIQTDAFKSLSTATLNPWRLNVQPAFQPTTKLDFRIRNPYQPNLIQPDTFEVLVFIKPVVMATQAIAGKATVTTQMPDIVTDVVKPYFLNRRNF